MKKVPYMHSVFHVFVLAGSICQFLAIALYVI
jgi:hemolysin III